jgi:hypothetical protein
MVLVIITSHLKKGREHAAANRTIEINEKAASMASIFLSLFLLHFPHFPRSAYKALRITVL